MRPLPYLHVPTVESKKAAARAIYAEGWRFSHCAAMSLDEALAAMANDHVSVCANVYLSDDRGFSVNNDVGDCTPVNSVTHLIRYCKTLGPRAPKSV